MCGGVATKPRQRRDDRSKPVAVDVARVVLSTDASRKRLVEFASLRQPPLSVPPGGPHAAVAALVAKGVRQHGSHLLSRFAAKVHGESTDAPCTERRLQKVCGEVVSDARELL